jgi:hypothetical protein
VIALLAVAFALADEAPPPTQQLSATYVVKVASREEAADALVDEAERLGGWFARLDDDEVQLRVPSSKADELMAFVPSVGLVASRDESVVDVRARLAELDARIASRRELLQQYLDLVKTADTAAVLQLEREISSAIQQIELMEGQRRRLADQAAIARVAVSFVFRDRTRPGQAGPSSFPWINSLSVAHVRSDLLGDRGRDDKRTGLPPVQVEGFAPYKGRKEHRAASPDGVLLRTRAVKHKPRAELSYWTEAVQTHLSTQGYTLLADEELPGARWLEWGLPVGEVDHTYVVVVKPDGRRIQLVEIEGPSEEVVARREALLAGVRSAL